MKILYIGNERRTAETVARALRGVSQNVPLAWTHSLDHCARYFAQNRDLTALVMDAQVHAEKWPPSLKDLRSLPVRPAIVVVVAEGAPQPFDSLSPAPDEYVINGPTFLSDLPVAVTRAVTRVRGTQPASTTPNDAAEAQQPFGTPERSDDDFLDLKLAAHGELEQKLAPI